MHHALTVRFVESVGDLDSILQCLIKRKRAFAQTVGQDLPFDVLHDDEVDAVLAADIVERTDVWMVQAGDGSGFPLESLPDFGMTGYVRGKDFDGQSNHRVGSRFNSQLRVAHFR